MGDVKPKTTFIARLYNSVRFTPSWIEVLAQEEAQQKLIEIIVRRSGETMLVHLTPEDGEAVIEAIRKAIEKLNGDAA